MVGEGEERTWMGWTDKGVFASMPPWSWGEGVIR